MTAENKTFPDTFDDIASNSPRGLGAISTGTSEFAARHIDDEGMKPYVDMSVQMGVWAENTMQWMASVGDNLKDKKNRVLVRVAALTVATQLAVACGDISVSGNESDSTDTTAQVTEVATRIDAADSVVPGQYDVEDLIGATAVPYSTESGDSIDQQFTDWVANFGEINQASVLRIGISDGTFYTINNENGLYFAIPDVEDEDFTLVEAIEQPVPIGTQLPVASGGAMELLSEGLLLHDGTGNPGRALLLVGTGPVDGIDAGDEVYESFACHIQATGETTGIVTCEPMNGPLWVRTPDGLVKPTSLSKPSEVSAVVTPVSAEDTVDSEIALTATPEATATATAAPTETATPAPTETPTQTPTAEIINSDSIVEMMVEADNNGDETITVESPTGVEVSIDIVPTEVRDQGVWNWDYRGFTRSTENGIQVYRTLQGVGENDNGQWFSIMSEMNVPGHGLVTIEYNPDQMADLYGFEDIQAVNPDNWQTILDGIWGDKDAREVAEKLNHVTSSDIAQNGLQDLSIYRTEMAEKGAGLSIILNANYKNTMFIAESWNGEPTYAFDGVVDGGRTQLDIYISHWMAPTFGDADLADYNIAYVALTTVDWLLHQSNGAGVVAGLTDFARSDMNPWKVNRGTTFPLPNRNSEILRSAGYDPDNIFSDDNIGSFVSRVQ